MKNIFLISWFQSENYGTCLQAYATWLVLNKMGNKVIFLDKRRYYSIKQVKYLVKKIYAKIYGKVKHGLVMNYGVYKREHDEKMQKISRMVKKNYACQSISSKKELEKIDSQVDCYLVGSDQMWNPSMLSPQYLLDFVPKNSVKPKYAYAASFGVDNIPENKKRIYKKYLPLFKQISVREPRAAELVKTLSGISTDVVLDPTFLLSQKEWRAFANESVTVKERKLNNYILCYFIGSSEFYHMNSVKILAELLGFQVVLLPMKEEDYLIQDPEIEIVGDACSYDFVSLIDHAKLVCTDSFHAVVFSFLLDTAFYDFPRFKSGDKNSQEARLQNIMSIFRLENSYWDSELSKEEIDQHLNTDYNVGYSILSEEREKCLKYLYNMIEGINR